VTRPFRLTRRGRLLLRGAPLLVATLTGVTGIAGRVGADPSVRVAPTPAPTPSPTTAAPTPRATPSRATATPTPTAVRTTARPTAKPSTARPSWYGTGRLVTAPGSSAVHGSGPLRRFTVEVEQGLPDSPAAMAKAVERVLFDQRSWGGGGRLSFQRVSSGPVAFRVVLASPATTDRLCAPLRTGGIFSCYMRGRAVLNAMRWYAGASAYAGDLAAYRVYMVNHEVGHALGHGHAYSCGAGGLARVMIQQTKGLRGCRRNPWPLADER
jgi:hypothetical protein